MYTTHLPKLGKRFAQPNQPSAVARQLVGQFSLFIGTRLGPFVRIYPPLVGGKKGAQAPPKVSTYCKTRWTIFLLLVSHFW